MAIAKQQATPAPSMTAWADLVMDNGELVRIEFREADFDNVHETLDNTRKRGDWWAPAQFDGCSATYMGLDLDRVAMSRVVGML